jgi:ABC-type dipeptide/oligopeptide/nickel transport system permease component
MLLPALVIAIPVGLTYSRYLRSSVREEYSKQYVDLAKVKGVSERRLL